MRTGGKAGEEKWAKKREKMERKLLVSEQTISLKWFCSCLIFFYDHSVLNFRATGTYRIWKLIVKCFQSEWIQYWVEPILTLKTDIPFALYLYVSHAIIIQFDHWNVLYPSISEGKRRRAGYIVTAFEIPKPFLVASTLVLQVRQQKPRDVTTSTHSQLVVGQSLLT